MILIMSILKHGVRFVFVLFLVDSPLIYSLGRLEMKPAVQIRNFSPPLQRTAMFSFPLQNSFNKTLRPLRMSPNFHNLKANRHQQAAPFRLRPLPRMACSHDANIQRRHLPRSLHVRDDDVIDQDLRVSGVQGGFEVLQDEPTVVVVEAVEDGVDVMSSCAW